MNNKYEAIAASIAVAMVSGQVNATVPTLLQAGAPTASLVMAGSPAVVRTLSNAIENQLCGGAANTLIANSVGGTTEFLAFSCFTATAINGIPVNTLITIYYRAEGGSAMGVLPIASGKQIKRLDLRDTTDCTVSGNAATCFVLGTTTTSGTTDSWTGAVVADTVQLGFTDVEPAQMTSADFPANYSAALFGTLTPSQLKALVTMRLFDQVFGLVVNKSGQAFSTVNLSKSSAANILSGNFSDWHNVPDAITGNAISSVPSKINLLNRELGSGPRIAANIFFLGYQCGTANSIPRRAGELLYTTVGSQLTVANNTPGSIAYTSIDQILNPVNGTKYTNLVLATIDGVTPSSLAAATGRYEFWYEATLIPAVGVSGSSSSLSTFLQSDLPKLATAPAAPDILVISGIGGNFPTVPPSSNGLTGTSQIFVNPYTRSGNSCNVPGEQI
jgi:hypothetical protein